MNTSTKTLLFGLVVAAIATAGLFFPKGGAVVDQVLGAFSGPDVYDKVRFYDSVSLKEPVVSIAATSVYATTTLSADASGTSYYLSASGTTMTLPAVTKAGTFFRFSVGGALDTGNVMVTSAEGDNIEGTLIVAGAVVDCDAVDAINFIVDGENVGDFVEVRSNGTKWIIGDSGVLTSAKMTCTG